jgi:ParB family chromosome partitioning protein
MVEKKALGRGLKALIGEPEEFARYEPSSQNHIMIDDIEPNPFQPRENFDDQKLADLASSIKRNGVLQPIILRRIGDKYQIVAGERRWRAAQKAELMSIPAIVRDASDEDMLTLALIENLQRQDLNPIEEATAYQDLIERYDLTQDHLALYIGKDRSTIANTLRLLALPADIQAHVSRGTLSMGHARALLSLPTPEAQRDLCGRIVDEGLSVRQVERLIKAGLRARSRRIRHVDAKSDPDIRRLEEELQRSLGAKVRIRTSGKRGSIQIEFYSPDELEGLIDRLLGGES